MIATIQPGATMPIVRCLGTVFSLVDGTPTVRANTYGARKMSNAQTAAKWRIAKPSMDWEHLTDAQRAGWGTYALGTPLAAPHGTRVTVSGYAHYIRSNRARAQHGLPSVTLPPITLGLPTVTRPTAYVDPTLKTLNVGVYAGDPWTTDPSSTMLLWISQQTSSSINTPSEYYMPIGSIAGSASGVIAVAVMPLSQQIYGNSLVMWMRATVSDGEGRLSE